MKSEDFAEGQGPGGVGRVGEDAALSRLAQADPAAFEDALRARVHAQLAASPLPLSSKVWFAPLAVLLLLAVALVSAGGAWQWASRSDAASGAAAPPAPVSPPASSMGARPGAAAEGAAVSSDRLWAMPGAVALRAGDGLPDEASSAAGWQVSAAPVDPEVLTRELAGLFAVDGPVRKDEYGWQVGAVDGSGPSVWVAAGGLGSWSVSFPGRDPWWCASPDGAEGLPVPPAASQNPAPEIAPVVPRQEGSSSGSGLSPGWSPPAGGCAQPGPPPSRAEARSLAEGFVRELGWPGNQDGVSVVWDSGSDEVSTWVSGSLEIDGSVVPVSWSFTFATGGVVYASGSAVSVTKVDRFETVGAKSAVERSSDPRFAAFGPFPVFSGDVMPLPMVEPVPEVAARADGSAAVLSTVGPAAPGRVQVLFDPKVVSSVSATVVPYWQPDGSLWMLPGFEVATGEGEAWTLIAVSESMVDFVTP